MTTSRTTPVELVFGAEREERFSRLRDALLRDSRDPRDREAFILVGEVVELLESLHPDDATAELMPGFVSFLHAAYLFWADGERLVEVDRGLLARLLAGALESPPNPAAGSGLAYYLQLPARRVWATATPDGPPEPLDGWFAVPLGGELRVLAVAGLHSGRPGLTVIEAQGARPTLGPRADGAPAFAPLVEGGARAGLASLADSAELLELAFRGHASVAGAGPPSGPHGLAI